ncbi:MAG: phosphoribosylanthranilate isomerase [Gammaproteobacteria bacterium]
MQPDWCTLNRLPSSSTDEPVTRTRVKICGITRESDLAAVVSAGADAVGFVFYPKSPRHVEPDQAARLIQSLPPFIQSVALFLNPETDYVREVIQRTSLDVLQFHGAEPAELCESFDRPYIKAVPMGGDSDQVLDVTAYTDYHPMARGFLLDSHALGEAGGSGKVFDWTRYPSHVARPMVLAGGLNPSNVAEAVQQVRPYGVDVSSGVESSLGIKDEQLVKTFIEQATGSTR